MTNRNYASHDEWKHWTWISQGDLLMNGAKFTQSGDPAAIKKYSKFQMIKSKPGTMASRLTRYAGALYCYAGKPC